MTILKELDHDWDQTVRRQRGRTPWRHHRVLDRFDDLETLIDFVHQRQHPLATDRVLAALARRAGSDQLAARTLLQAMVPALRRIASVLRHRAAADEVAAAIVAAAWEQIRTYPHQRRPSRIAANIAYETYRHALDRITVDEGHEPFEESWSYVDELVYQPWELASVMQEAVRRGELARPDVELIIQTRILGRTLAELATQLDVTEACLRKRRWRSEQRLALVAHGKATSTAGAATSDAGRQAPDAAFSVEAKSRDVP